MRFLFLELTTFTQTENVRLLLALIDRINQFSATRRLRLFSGSRWRVIKGSIEQRVTTSGLRFNTIVNKSTDFVVTGVRAVRTHSLLQPSASAHLWNKLDASEQGAALAAGKIEVWKMLIPMFGIQALGGKEPTVLSITFETAHDLDPDVAENFLIEFLTDCIPISSPLPSDVTGYASLGKDAWSNGGMNIVYRSRTKFQDYDSWRTRFLQPKYWLMASEERVKRIASVCGVQSRSIATRELWIVRMGDSASNMELLQEKLDGHFVHFRDPNMPQ